MILKLTIKFKRTLNVRICYYSIILHLTIESFILKSLWRTAYILIKVLRSLSYCIFIHTLLELVHPSLLCFELLSIVYLVVKVLSMLHLYIFSLFSHILDSLLLSEFPIPFKLYLLSFSKLLIFHLFISNLDLKL